MHILPIKLIGRSKPGRLNQIKVNYKVPLKVLQLKIADYFVRLAMNGGVEEDEEPTSNRESAPAPSKKKKLSYEEIKELGDSFTLPEEMGAAWEELDLSALTDLQRIELCGIWNGAAELKQLGLEFKPNGTTEVIDLPF